MAGRAAPRAAVRAPRAPRGRRAPRALLALLAASALLLLVAPQLHEELGELGSKVMEALRELGRGPSRGELVEIVLEALNRERLRHGVPPVRLLNLSVAQSRADDMVGRGYFGHCDPEGGTPFRWYTSLGGAYFFEENVAAARGPVSLRAFAEEAVLDMIYDDAESGWLHRDSLLDPTNNYVDIGVSWRGGYAVIVIHMQKAWVRWLEGPSYDPATGLFRARGLLLLNGSRVTAVVVYRANATAAGACPLPGVECTCTSYGLGEPVAAVAPGPGVVYAGVETVVAARWAQEGRLFEVEFAWRPRAPGTYVVVVWAENTLGLRHPFDEGRYADELPVLAYAIEWPGGG